MSKIFMDFPKKKFHRCRDSPIFEQVFVLGFVETLTQVSMNDDLESKKTFYISRTC